MKTIQPQKIPKWIEAMLPEGHTRYCIDTGSGQIMHVMEAGEGTPVLMLHGNPTWGFLYRKVISQLGKDNIRCITPDLIGLGFSSKPRAAGMHTLENHARWIGSLIDHFNIDGMVFVGQDWGGPIGLRALADRPHLLKGLVILNTAIAPPKPDFKPTAFHKFSRMPLVSDIVFRVFHFPQIALHKAQGNPDSIRGEVARAYRYPLRRFRDNLAPLALARMVPDSLSHPSVEPLKRCQSLVESFEGPCEIVWGRKDPVLGRVLKRVKALLPDADVTETDAGHFIQEEEPQRIAEAIRRVVAKI